MAVAVVGVVVVDRDILGDDVLAAQEEEMDDVSAVVVVVEKEVTKTRSPCAAKLARQYRAARQTTTSPCCYSMSQSFFNRKKVRKKYLLPSSLSLSYFLSFLFFDFDCPDLGRLRFLILPTTKFKKGEKK